MNIYSRERARRSLHHTLFFKILSQVATVVSYAVLVRSISVEAFGVLNLLYAAIPLLATFGSLGLDHVLRRFQPEYLADNRDGQALWVLKRVRVLRALSNAALVLAVLACWNWVAGWVELGPYRAEFAFFSLIIFLHFQILILQYGCASYMQHGHAVGSVAVQSWIKLGGYGGLALWSTLDVRGALAVDLAAYLVAFVVVYVAYRRIARSVLPVAPNRQDRSRMFRYGAYSHMNDAASVLQYSETDRYFLAALANAATAGTYAFYTRLCEMITSLGPLRLFDNVVQPMFFRVPHEEAREKLPRYFGFLVDVGLVYQLPLIVATLIMHRDIALLLGGEQYVSYSWLLPIVVTFATADWVFSVPIHLVAQYRERARLIFVSQMFGLYQIVAMLSLIPWLGVLGAAIASGTFHVFRNAYVWYQVREEGRWTNWRPALLSCTLIWGSCGVCLWMLRDLAGLEGLPLLVIGPMICAVFGWLHLRSAALTDWDRETLADMMGERGERVLELLRLGRWRTQS